MAKFYQIIESFMVLSQLINLLDSHCIFGSKPIVNLQPQCGKCLCLLVGNDNADEGEKCLSRFYTLVFKSLALFQHKTAFVSTCYEGTANVVKYMEVQ